MKFFSEKCSKKKKQKQKQKKTLVTFVLFLSFSPFIYSFFSSSVFSLPKKVMRTCELCGKKVGNRAASIIHRNPTKPMGFMPWDEAVQAEYTAIHCPAYLQYNIDKYQLKKPDMPDPRKATFTTNGEDVTHINLTPPALDGSFWKRFESKKSLWKMPKHSKETDSICLMPYHKDVSQNPFSGFWFNIRALPFSENSPNAGGSCSFDTVYYDNNGARL